MNTRHIPEYKFLDTERKKVRKMEIKHRIAKLEKLQQHVAAIAENSYKNDPLESRTLELFVTSYELPDEFEFLINKLHELLHLLSKDSREIQDKVWGQIVSMYKAWLKRPLTAPDTLIYLGKRLLKIIKNYEQLASKECDSLTYKLVQSIKNNNKCYSYQYALFIQNEATMI